MAPTASFHSPKVQFITKTVPTLQDPLKEIEKNKQIVKSTVDEDEVANELKYFKIVRPLKNDRNVRFIYIDDSKYGYVWPNISMFIVLHSYYLYAMFKIIFFEEWYKIQKTWLFSESLFN